jgi:hypothetical protein
MEPPKSEKESLADEPIQTYEEFREVFAKDMRESPPAVLFKCAVEFVRYLFTREALMVALLMDKGVITADEIESYFGHDAHQKTQEAGLKALKKALLHAASRGKIVSEGGKQITPDDVLVYTDDIFDLSGKGWTGKKIESIFDHFGKGSMIREAYDKYVSDMKRINALRAGMREHFAESQKASERKATATANERVDRVRRLRIYLSQCNIANKRPPTEEEAQKMLDGALPIPESV